MRKFLAAMVPVTLMTVPVWIYEAQFDALDHARGWVVHTEQARALAAAIGSRSAAADAADLVREFAALTADNPEQVATAAAMKAALAAGDVRGVSDLASRAAAAEGRLMVAREADYRGRFDSARHMARWVLAAALGGALLYELTELVLRSNPGPSPLRRPGS